MPDHLVPLCQCIDIAEAQVLRASLEARGVTVYIEGEHQRGIMGVVGAAVELRLMVLSSQLEFARELASDVIPDLAPDFEADEEPAGEGLSPARRPPAEDLVDYRDDDDRVADVEDDDSDLSGPRKKSFAVALLLAVLGLAVGLLHVYAGEEKTGGALFVLAAIGIGLLIAGQPIGSLLLVGVWAVDIARGFVLLRRYNLAIAAPRSGHGSTSARTDTSSQLLGP